MINEKLVQQVQDGTHCIRMRDGLTTKELEDFQSLIKYCFPQDIVNASGACLFYYASKEREYYCCDNINPTGLTPILLDDFFKGEELGWTDRHVCGIEQEDDLPPPQSSLPSGVQTMRWEIKFGARLKCRLQLKDGVLTIEDAVDGWGDNYNDAEVTTLSTPSLPPSEEKYCNCVTHVTCECADNCECCGKPIAWDKQPKELELHEPSEENGVEEAIEFMVDALENEVQLRNMIDKWCISQMGNTGEALEKADLMFTAARDIFYKP